MGGGAWIVLLPGLLSGVPAVMPPTVGTRRLALLGLGMATVTLILALVAVWPGLPGWVDFGWRDDSLSRTLSMFPALTWFMVALRLATAGDPVRGGSGVRRKGWLAAAQLGTACAMAACRVEVLAWLPVLFAVLLSAMARLDGRDWRGGALGLAPVLAMAAGIVVLSATLGVPARWAGLAGPDGQPLLMAGLALLVAPVLVLAMAAWLRPLLAVQDGSGFGLARLLMAVPAFSIALRAGAAVGAIAVAAGVVWILLSLALLPRHRGLGQRVSLAASAQCGACLVGIGVGGAGGIAGAVMLLGFLSALLPMTPPGAAGGSLRKLAIAALVGLPPLGSFSAGMVVLLRLFAVSTWLALLVLGGFAVGALAVLGAARRPPALERAGSGPGPDGRRWAGVWIAAGVSMLVVSLWFGLAMPGAVSDWLLALGQSRP